MSLVFSFVILQAAVLFDCSLSYYEAPIRDVPWLHENRNAIKAEQYKWPNGIIPYIFDNSIKQKDRLKITQAFGLFNTETCVTFIPKLENHYAYIRFAKHESACASTIGYRTNRTLNVLLSNWCLHRIGAIQHELIHVMGIAHEQCRPDRDKYITILWDNIRSENFFDFAKMPEEDFDSYGLKYDFHSLMHYPRNAFAKSGANLTMYATHNASLELGQYDGPTENDLEKIRRMYSCSEQIGL